MAPTTRQLTAFTFLELVIVVVIIAVLALAALPRYINREEGANELETLQSLTVLRGAIERSRTEGQGFPHSVEQISEYLDRPFPAAKVGGIESSHLKVVSAHGPLTIADVDSNGGWLYNSITGELRLNVESHFTY